MAPTLSLDDGSPDEVAERRGKRETTSPNNTLSTTPGNILAMPFMFFILFTQVLYQFVVNFVGSPVKTVQEAFLFSEQQSDFLETVPVEQREQQETLHNVHEQQIYQKEKIENLRRRIQRIEEKRAARQTNVASSEASAKVKDTKGE
mmetsp:Transcript_9751/g.14025  ORF Transcript_9751/g.14025 Transcript_9751/m.14025 type:complete len:147 (-) Transcript_9751:200-640(-)|eukprot:CAMPEP_0202448196 /NCGR_PEP_ID=MMETSP1360-20130828/7006_1 /ASSEMBLY_ACC=CAM_ASM_000848 /TAXON_ID=515479 /ORGANISM="Licmophora paradoxa, Strain CCMP2313" /LENGTH=146 /DNA_ID=CAMNT_0049065655 /DNA_START=84 /DNA_END=524 /DNA_ORIENTATION=-